MTRRFIEVELIHVGSEKVCQDLFEKNECIVEIKFDSGREQFKISRSKIFPGLPEPVPIDDGKMNFWECLAKTSLFDTRTHIIIRPNGEEYTLSKIFLGNKFEVPSNHLYRGWTIKKIPLTAYDKAVDIVGEECALKLKNAGALGV